MWSDEAPAPAFFFSIVVSAGLPVAHAYLVATSFEWAVLLACNGLPPPCCGVVGLLVRYSLIDRRDSISTGVLLPYLRRRQGLASLDWNNATKRFVAIGPGRVVRVMHRFHALASEQASTYRMQLCSHALPCASQQ